MTHHFLDDERFVQAAYREIEGITLNNIFTQSFVQGQDDSDIQLSPHAAFVTAVNIYHSKGLLEESYIYRAVEAKTSKQIRDLVDEMYPNVKEYLEQAN